MPTPSLELNIHLTHNLIDNSSVSICSKVNVIARQEFELAYFLITAQYLNRCTTEFPPNILLFDGQPVSVSSSEF